MTVVDAHCHASPLWFEPVELLVAQMDLNGVAKAVLTQVLGQFDNRYQEACIARYPGRFASVGAVDPGAEDAADAVRRWADRGMTGLRLRPEARSPGSDPLAVWRAAAERGLAISCGGAPANILAPEFAALLAELGDLPIVLEQLGGWTRPDCDRQHATWQGILALARFPNVSLKLSTLGQIAPRQIGKPLPPEGEPVLDASAGAIVLEALDAFGPQRLMWGSDHPVVSSREGYGNALRWTRALFDGRPEDVDLIFGRNADRLFFP